MNELVHTVTARAPARLLFDLVADVVQAPQYFPTHLHAWIVRTESPERDLVERWVIDNGSVRGWRLFRTRDTEKLVIAFQHETPKAPLSFMRGEWRFEETADGGTLITVAHRFDLVGGAPEAAAAKAAGMLDANVPKQLAGIAALAGRIDALRAATTDSVRHVRVAAPAGEVVASATALVGDDESYARVRPEEGRLVFKQHAGLAPGLHSSTGAFEFLQEDGGVTVRLSRSVTLAPQAGGEGVEASRRLDAESRDWLDRLAALGEPAAAG
ncbi:Ribosome association toxin PasT (RatA) of the RatAB toxin-antitoxin module [Actinacidiphila yanglinensis]|uniref:Ribosome association toxin PasT (RatA) of the RatAB toxin-antitoxin module n=1 Tax=Actinacidiphila yanglinensis TaxID=310779 RepID=A0A1H6E9M8_9ACTN|nr:aromatase/cyclase [Actinacidiphila yanglinensis]SEG93535.1 Ribosome association toxin PasT (RatA) of the RatAB toxin-antitoxin module [Actinacidiphila yanglinensis]